MSQFIMTKEMPVAGNEQETIISYDNEAKEWHFYTNYPPHARKWEDKIIPSENYVCKKVYHKKTGELIELCGIINGSVGINGKRQMTEEQRRAVGERFKKLRSKKAD